MRIWRGLKRREDLETVRYSREEAEGGVGTGQEGMRTSCWGVDLDNANKAILLGNGLQRPGLENAFDAEEKIEFLAGVAQ